MYCLPAGDVEVIVVVEVIVGVVLVVAVVVPNFVFVLVQSQAINNQKLDIILCLPANGS